MAFKMKGFSGFKQVREGTKVRAEKDPKPKKFRANNNPARTFGTEFQEEKPTKLNTLSTNIKLPTSPIDEPTRSNRRKTFGAPPPSTSQKIINVLKKHPSYVVGKKAFEFGKKLKNKLGK